jgi:hypothetical protein
MSAFRTVFYHHYLCMTIPLVVERSHIWMNRFRRILMRWEKKSQHYLAFFHLAVR